MSAGYGLDELHEADQVVEQIGDLSMRFSRTFRLPKYPDGRQESDSEHSQMLAMIAVELASRFYPELDLGKIALLSVIHDLDEIEAEGGDTPTLGLTDEDLIAKKSREAEGRVRLRANYPFAKHLFDLMDGYDPEGSALDDEAAFVFVVDKIVPSVVHIQNRTVDLRSFGITSGEDLRQSVEMTQRRLVPFGERFPLLLALRDLRLMKEADIIDSMTH